MNERNWLEDTGYFGPVDVHVPSVTLGLYQIHAQGRRQRSVRQTGEGGSPCRRLRGSVIRRSGHVGDAPYPWLDGARRSRRLPRDVTDADFRLSVAIAGRGMDAGEGAASVNQEARAEVGD